MERRQIKVGIIDTGVEKDHRRLTGCRITGCTIFKRAGGSRCELMIGSFQDEDGHGTGICSIIYRHLPEAEFIMIKLASESIMDEMLMTEAINYLVDKGGVNIINISMGIATDSPSNDLSQACKRAITKNIFIVASSYYLPKKCYPASFGGVLSVGIGIIKDRSTFRFNPNSNIKIWAKGSIQRVATVNNRFKLSHGNSLATAHFTGILGKIMLNLQHVDYNSVATILKDKSDNKVISFKSYNDRGNILVSENANSNKQDLDMLGADLHKDIVKIALFPASEKEIKNILENEVKCVRKITLKIDYPRNLGAFTEDLNSAIPLIKRLPNSNDFELFDTLVVGYILDNLFDVQLLFSLKVIRECVKYNKNFLIWDREVYNFIKDVIDEEFKAQYSGKIQLINIGEEHFRALIEYERLPDEKAPVLCVIGTGSKRGKFNTQLKIKNYLESAEYKPAFISTEPQGILFGADALFPIGYKPSVKVGLGQWDEFLGIAIKYIDFVKRPDIIITGTQGSVIPRHPVYMGYDTGIMRSLVFVTSVHPDAIVCSIGPDDNLNYIKKTLDVIKCYVRLKTLFCSMTPWVVDGNNRLYKLTKEEYIDRMNFFSESLGCPVIDILDFSNKTVVLNSIQNAFSKPKENEN